MVGRWRRRRSYKCLYTSIPNLIDWQVEEEEEEGINTSALDIRFIFCLILVERGVN